MPDTPNTLPDFSRPPFAGAPEARFEPLPADGVLPEGFFSTSNLPTYIKVGGRWLAPTRPRMDCVVVKRDGGLETIEPRRLRKGELIAMGEAEDGTEGIVVHAQGFLGGTHGANEFRFMSTEVSRERPVNYEELAARLGEEKRKRRLSRLGGRAGAGAFAGPCRLRVVHPQRVRAGRAGRAMPSPCTTSRRRSSAPRWA